VAVGILLAIIALRDGLSLDVPRIAWIPIAAVILFTVATQLPPAVYNFHDDYQKYFAYPVRMLQTGTVFGSPLSAIGLQTLGAQAFLDGFVLAFFPIRYVNAVDAVFGLFLCLILATQFTKKRVMTMVCLLSVVFINPQYVNISTLFCGSALILAIVASEEAATLGLLYAALIAMKPIFVVFVAVHLLAIAAWRFRFLLRAGFTAAIFLAPWALLHAPHYLDALRGHRWEPAPFPGDIDTEKLNIFSMNTLPYGSTAANYTALVIAFVICGILCRRAKPLVACCIAGAASFVIFIYVLGPMQYGYEHGLRYFVPVALGLAPAIFGLTAENRKGMLPVLVALIPLLAFAPSLRVRILSEAEAHSAVSYWWLAKDPDYLAYNRKILFGPEAQTVKALQDRIPAGEPILAWMNTPFLLDYKRNRIIDIDTAGVGVPWAKIPAARYLIWDYAGFATADEEDYLVRALNAGAGERRDSRLTLDFIGRLERMCEKGKVLYDDGEVKIVRL
jgi:hypothetical protein